MGGGVQGKRLEISPLDAEDAVVMVVREPGNANENP
jgi:hypothetical protein